MCMITGNPYRDLGSRGHFLLYFTERTKRLRNSEPARGPSLEVITGK